MFAPLSTHSTNGSPSPTPKVVYANPKIVDDSSLAYEIFQLVRPPVLDPQNVIISIKKFKKSLMTNFLIE